MRESVFRLAGVLCLVFALLASIQIKTNMFSDEPSSMIADASASEIVLVSVDMDQESPAEIGSVPCMVAVFSSAPVTFVAEKPRFQAVIPAATCLKGRSSSPPHGPPISI